MLTPFRKRALVISALAIAGLGFIALTRAQFMGSVNALHIDLQQPDILVRSARLSDLPKDLVNAPLLKGILTDEVIHYYEDHPTRLSLLGTLKRLAYDHQLSWTDQMVSMVINAPGELSLWRDGKGRPEYFMLVLRQNLVAQALQHLSKVTLPDEQLSEAGDLSTPTGEVKVYALKINQRNTWLLISQGDRLVVLSDPGMLLESSQSMARDSRKAVSAIFKTHNQAPSPQAASFGLPALAGTKQQIVARSDYLSFGYQPFFPGLAALKVEQSTAGQWQFSAKLTPDGLSAWQNGAQKLWRALPRGHAFCVALPMDWRASTEVLGAVSQDKTLALFKDLNPVAATCWNRSGGLNAPMLAAQLNRAPQPTDDQALSALLTDVTRKVPGPQSGAAKDAGIAPTVERPLPAGGHGKVWVRAIPHALGNVTEHKVSMHQVSVVRLDRTVMAGIDKDSLGQALAVSRKSYPTMADEHKGQGTPVLMVDSAQLAQMLDAETWATLSPEDTPTFYRVARQLLPARLQALRNLGRWQVTLPTKPVMAPRLGEGDVGKSGWVNLTVQNQR